MTTPKYTVVCEVGLPTARAEIVESGLEKPAAGELMLKLENGSYPPLAGEEVHGIGVRDDVGGAYLTPDEFFDHRY